MTLKKIYGYLVGPLRGKMVGSKSVIRGGNGRITVTLRDTLERVYIDADFGSKTGVQFIFDENRGNEFRNNLMSFLFNEEAEEESAKWIANHLGNSMDGRSNECLFVMTKSEGSGNTMTFVGWVFPKEEALQFNPNDGNIIDVLENVFSRTSKLRKAVKYSGVNSKASFMSGKILDFQTGTKTGTKSTGIADYWIENFLLSKLSLNDEVGSQELAKALEKLYNSNLDASIRSRVIGAMIVIKTKPGMRTSGRHIGESYFNDDPKVMARFKGYFKSPELYDSEFQINVDSFKEIVKEIIYTLENGIIVTAQISKKSKSLEITQNGSKRILTASGVIEAERIR